VIRYYVVLFASFLAIGFPISASGQQDTASIIGKEITDFKLKNIDGSWFSLNDVADAKGYMLVFTCNHCPFARLYPARFNALSKRYTEAGVPLIAINPMDSLVYVDESFEEMQLHASKQKFEFPYLQDATQEVAREFNVQHTPQAFVIWKNGSHWIVRYSGAVDDNGEHPENATPWLALAVEQLLSGQPVENSQTESFGCRVFYRTER
jgi:peroxiredoxin